MKNIEIKARYDDLEKARQIARRIGAVHDSNLFQVDTYFDVTRGRLKLREIDDCENQLIYYERADVASPKTSEYEILPVDEAVLLKTVLEKSIGIWKIVSKQRDVFLYEEVRIHLDRVEGLGNFIEFEGVIQKSIAESATHGKVEWLLQEFEISPKDLIEGSYSDLIGDVFIQN